MVNPGDLGKKKTIKNVRKRLKIFEKLCAKCVFLRVFSQHSANEFRHLYKRIITPNKLANFFWNFAIFCLQSPGSFGTINGSVVFRELTDGLYAHTR